MIVTADRVRGHYEVQETPYAKDYVWVPGGTMTVADGTFPWRADYERWIEESAARPEEQEWEEIRALS